MSERVQKMTIVECSDFFKSYNDNISKGLMLFKCKVGLKIENWTLAKQDENPNFNENIYKFMQVPIVKEKIRIEKETNFKFFILSKDDRGRVFCNHDLYKLLREDKGLVLNVDLAKAEYRDNLTNERNEIDSFEKESFIDDIEKQDINSLLMIHRFISSIASGVRRPSDTTVAKEMKDYLTSFLSRNKINL